MVRRILSLVLCLMLLFQQVPAAGFMPSDFDTEAALRLAVQGDATWLSRFPNGLINFMGTQFSMGEESAFLEIPIMRQAGTSGTITMDLKASGIHAKYGEDYVIRLYENAEKYQVPSDAEVPDSLAPLTDPDEPIPISIASPAGMEAISPAGMETISSPGMETASPSVTTTTSPAISTATTPAIVAPHQAHTDLPPAAPSVGTGRPTSLRQARSAYLQQASDRPDWMETDKATLSSLKTESDQYLRNLPGTETTLVFEEGEYLKYIYLVPLNDTLSESEEQILLFLSNPGGGAVRGEFDQAWVNLVDDEPREAARFEVLTPTVVATNGTAEITVGRMGGIHHYATVKVGTESGTALAGADYAPGLSELLFTPGMETQKIKVSVLDNPARATNSYFIVALDRENPEVDPAKAEAIVTFPASTTSMSAFQMQTPQYRAGLAYRCPSRPLWCKTREQKSCRSMVPPRRREPGRSVERIFSKMRGRREIPLRRIMIMGSGMSMEAFTACPPITLSGSLAVWTG